MNSGIFRGVVLLISLVLPSGWLLESSAEVLEEADLYFWRLGFASVQRKAVWLSSEMPIPVCWENPSDQDAYLREAVRDVVRQTWEHHSQLRFMEDWPRCAMDSRGIRIRVNDHVLGAKTVALGRMLDKMPNGVILNFTFDNWSVSCRSKIEFCVRAVAVHEFGHAIGFAHEQNRSEAPPECRHESQGTVGDWNITGYDPESIMNYCNPKWNGNGKLSARDIIAVQRIYGPR